MIDLIPGHGWWDIVAIVATGAAAIGLFVLGMTAICGRLNRRPESGN